MCSYCGCEAEPLIEALMGDHAVIADLAYRAVRALDSDDAGTAQALLAELSERFDGHSRQEEDGLFAELAAVGEAVVETRGLIADHRRLRPLLASGGLAADGDRLRGVLADVARHAETEENDLFPYALQVLPSDSWDRINQGGVDVLRQPAGDVT